MSVCAVPELPLPFLIELCHGVLPSTCSVHAYTAPRLRETALYILDVPEAKAPTVLSTTTGQVLTLDPPHSAESRLGTTTELRGVPIAFVIEWIKNQFEGNARRKTKDYTEFLWTVNAQLLSISFEVLDEEAGLRLTVSISSYRITIRIPTDMTFSQLKALYLSPTIQAIYKICDKHNIPLKLSSALE